MQPQDDPVLKQYARLAQRYDTRWSSYVEATTRETLRRFDAPPATKLLDVGCGTGTLLHTIGRSHPKVQLWGIDPSREMLAIAHNKLGSHANLKLGQAESLPFPDHFFDIVVSTSVFHYLRDPHKVLGEFARVLKAGGKVVITDWCNDYLACRLLSFYLRVFSRVHFRSYGSNDYRKMLKASQFKPITIERYKISWRWGLITLTGHKTFRLLS